MLQNNTGENEPENVDAKILVCGPNKGTKQIDKRGKMRGGSVLDSSYYLLENFAGIVFGQLATANDEIKKLAIRAISGGGGCIIMLR